MCTSAHPVDFISTLLMLCARSLYLTSPVFFIFSRHVLSHHEEAREAIIQPHISTRLFTSAQHLPPTSPPRTDHRWPQWYDSSKNTSHNLSLILHLNKFCSPFWMLILPQNTGWKDSLSPTVRKHTKRSLNCWELLIGTFCRLGCLTTPLFFGIQKTPTFFGAGISSDMIFFFIEFTCLH